MALSFLGTWSPEIEKDIIQWSKEKLLALGGGDEPDEELLSYIAVMVGNKKTMSDILNELKEFIDDEKSRSELTTRLLHLKFLSTISILYF